MYEFFKDAFPSEISLAEFKRQAEAAIISNSGQRCSRGKFSEDSSKRTKSITDFVEENTLRDLKLYTRAKNQLTQELGNIRSTKVEEVARTRKFTSLSRDWLVLDLLNQALAEILHQQPMKSWTDVAHMLQATQLAYQALTSKPRAKSDWKESILKKIEKANSSREILTKARDAPLLVGLELAQARKVMRELGLIPERRDDLVEAISKLSETAAVNQRKLDTHERRKEQAKADRSYELYRSGYYRNLRGETAAPVEVPSEDVRAFWSTMWNSPQDQKDYSEYLRECVPSAKAASDYFPSFAEFVTIVGFLPAWKAAGCDGIFNFFLKRCSSLHASIYELVKRTCMGEEVAESWFFRGITYLIPKGTPKQGSDFRPITCMSNLYKLTTKCVTQVMQGMVEQRGLLAENQLGTVRMVQGAKEQAMLNTALNKAAGNDLKTSWIDVKKAFDSVEHTYLIECIERLNFPPWVAKFLRATIKRWQLEIKLENVTILEKKIERGILQGDSLSPLLFVLCMDPLSRKLNSAFPKVAIKTEGDHYVMNHLLFIDDLKLFSESEEVLGKMMAETEMFFEVVGLEMNRAKSATNCGVCEGSTVVLGVTEGYKYLGVTENRKSEVVRETYERVRAEILARVESICKSGLNGRNTIAAINEYALSVMNYYIGAIPLENADYLRIDEEVRKILVRHKVHLQPANTEQLYLPRKELGRGLGNMVHKSERIELQLFNALNEARNTSPRRAAILKVMQDENMSTALIAPYLAARYNIEGEVTLETLEAAQKGFLYSEIKNKTRHEKLYSDASSLAAERQFLANTTQSQHRQEWY